MAVEEKNIFGVDNMMPLEESGNLFSDEPEVEDEVKETGEDTPEEKTEDLTEVHQAETLFDDPESVGNEKNKKESEKPQSSPNDEDSSTANFYSSITDALVEEGVFPDLTEEEIQNVNSPAAFKEMINNQVRRNLEESQQRVLEALSNNVDNNEIKFYEQTLSYLENIPVDLLSEDSEQGDDLRRKLIQQDYMNRGYSVERAIRLTERAFQNGDDIEEAKLALEENKKHFSDKYQNVIDEAKKTTQKEKEEQMKREAALKEDIMTKDKIFGDIDLDKRVRQKIYDNISKPVYKDNNGKYYTALQKYRMENENDFLKHVSTFFTLTDGFKNYDKLFKPAARKEIKRKLAELETTLNNSPRSKGGTPKYVGNSESGSHNFLDQGFVIDVNNKY